MARVMSVVRLSIMTSDARYKIDSVFPSCGQCSRREGLIESLFDGLSKIDDAAEVVETAANPDAIPHNLMRAIHNMSRARFNVACTGLAPRHKDIAAGDVSIAGVETISEQDREVLVIALEAWQDKPASFETVLHMNRRERLAMMATDDCCKIAAIMTDAQHRIDARWTYVHENEQSRDYVVCCGPGERTELTIEEARWNLLIMLRLPAGSSRVDFIAALVAAQ